MSKELAGVRGNLDRLMRLGTIGGLTDSQLLERFAAGDDESASLAFEVILNRHGPMVLRVCRLVLRDTHAAEDAFQATFLVLARKARTLRSRELLCNWLYGVAARTARKTRAINAHRHAREHEAACRRSAAVVEPPRDAGIDDLDRVLHEEIDRLPRSYREVVVVCYLQGISQSQAATQLREAESTIRGRLARARKLLRKRLVRRGVALSTGLFAHSSVASAPIQRLPVSIAHSTAGAAIRFLRRGTTTDGAVSATAQEIATGVLSTMWIHSLRTFAAVGVVAGILAAGVSLVIHPAAEARLQAQQANDERPPAIAISSLEPAQDGEPKRPVAHKEKGKGKGGEQGSQSRSTPTCRSASPVRSSGQSRLLKIACL